MEIFLFERGMMLDSRVLVNQQGISGYTRFVTLRDPLGRASRHIASNLA